MTEAAIALLVERALRNHPGGHCERSVFEPKRCVTSPREYPARSPMAARVVPAMPPLNQQRNGRFRHETVGKRRAHLLGAAICVGSEHGVRHDLLVADK